MGIGIVKWFDSLKGFGVLGTPNSGEFFLHSKNLLSPSSKILKGVVCVFAAEIEQNKNIAKECKLLSSEEDWYLALKYLGKESNVSMEESVIKTGRYGRTYKTTETKKYGLIRLTTNQYFKGKTEDEIKKIFKSYFDSQLEPELFTTYCYFIEVGITKYNYIEKNNIPNFFNELFTYFGSNLNDNLRFHVWKERKFRYIGLTADFEISQNIIEGNILKIGINELQRIKEYSYGKMFCLDFVSKAIKNISYLSIQEIKDIYKQLSVVDYQAFVNLNEKLDEAFAEVLLGEIEKQSANLGTISTHDEYSKYKHLKQLIPNELAKTKQEFLDTKVNKIIISNSTNQFKFELWLIGLVQDIPFELIFANFYLQDTTVQRRIEILQMAELSVQIEIIKQYVKIFNPINTFLFLEEYLKKSNKLSHFNLKNEIFNAEFWKDKNGADLINFTIKYVNNNSTKEELYELYLVGLTQIFPVDLITINLQNIHLDQYEVILNHSDCSNDLAYQLISGKLDIGNITEISILLTLSKKYLNRSLFNEFDKKIKSLISESDYFNLWTYRKVTNFPEQYIQTILNDNYDNYEKINGWISNNIITKENIISFLLSNIRNSEEITNRVIFYRIFNHVKFLLQLDAVLYEQIRSINNEFCELLLWFLGNNDDLNFDLLKRKFIYFNPEHQVVALRKVFYLIHKGVCNLEIEQLNELTRIDLDLYQTNLSVNSGIPLDISTDIILKALLSYKQRGKFLVEGELLYIVINNLYGNNKQKFKLGSYFEECKGRMTIKYDWNTKGKILKIKKQNTQGVEIEYFAISFDWEQIGWESFNTIKEEVKKISGRKWNQNENHWGVPLKYEDEVITFAKKYCFLMNFTGNVYVDNKHLAKLNRKDIPNGITFCEGRLANKEHNTFKTTFWWCGGNQPCFQNCETIHKAEDWQNYTLLDFVQILGLGIDEHKINPLDFVYNGYYYQFISLINRFNRLLEKIYCEECDEILYPAQTSHFAAYTVVRFCCENSKCSKHKEVVYLNHCLNSQCNDTIIDSRISKKCPNGLYICEKCGSCCSHSFFERRLSNLNTADNFDNAQKIWIYEDTKYKYDNKLGHLDRADYYCHKCSKKMKEIGVDIFKCECENVYEVAKYNFQRPHKYLNQENSNLSSSGFDDIPV